MRILVNVLSHLLMYTNKYAFLLFIVRVLKGGKKRCVALAEAFMPPKEHVSTSLPTMCTDL